MKPLSFSSGTSRGETMKRLDGKLKSGELAELERQGKVVADGAVRPSDDKYWLILHGKTAVSRLEGTHILEHLRRGAAGEPLQLVNGRLDSG